MFVLQQVINGLAQGSIYALMAIGYSTILGIVGLVTFVHGEVVMVGAFAGYYAYTFLSAGFFGALFAGFAASWILGYLIDRVCYRPFRRAPSEIALICTIGMSIFLKALGQVAFGTTQKLMPDLFGSGAIVLGGIRIGYIQVFVIAVVVVLCLALQQLLYRTRIGMYLRAVSMDKDAAVLTGVDVNRTISIGNSLGCALGGVSGVLFAVYYNAVHPLMGGTAAMKAFAATVFGGLGSIPGAAIGGLILGIFETFGVTAFSSGYRDIIAFALLILVLLIRPSGLLGRKVEVNS